MYDPVNKAYSAAQHRLANFFETQTRFWKFGTWPDWAQDSMLEGNKNDYTLRFNLFYFLTKNNLFGPIAKKWVLANDVDQDGELQFPTYPGHVWHDMTRLEAQAKDGTLFINDKPMMNMYENQVTRQGNLSHYAPYERWITRGIRGTSAEEEGKGDISRPTPRQGQQPRASWVRRLHLTGPFREEGPPGTYGQPVRDPQGNAGVRYPPRQAGPHRRATSSLRLYGSKGKEYLVTTYMGKTYRLN